MKGVAETSWGGNATIVGLEKRNPTYYREYSGRPPWESWKKLNLKIIEHTEDHVLLGKPGESAPQPGTVDVLHEAFMDYANAGSPDRFRQYLKMLRKLNWRKNWFH